METKKQMEKTQIEKELARLMEMTLNWENELNSLTLSH